MAQTLKIKRSAVAGKIPTTSDLELGELGLNTYDGKLFTKKSVAGTESIVEIVGGGGGASVSSVLDAGDFNAGTSTATSGSVTGLIDAGNFDNGVSTAGNAGGAGGGPILESSIVISTSTILNTGKHGLSIGPVDIADLQTVTVPANAFWVIL